MRWLPFSLSDVVVVLVRLADLGGTGYLMLLAVGPSTVEAGSAGVLGGLYSGTDSVEGSSRVDVALFGYSQPRRAGCRLHRALGTQIARAFSLCAQSQSLGKVGCVISCGEVSCLACPQPGQRCAPSIDAQAHSCVSTADPSQDASSSAFSRSSL